MFGEIPRYQHTTEAKLTENSRAVTKYRRLSSEIECCAANGALEYHCLDKFLWMKSRETISLKGVRSVVQMSTLQWSRVSSSRIERRVGRSAKLQR